MRKYILIFILSALNSFGGSLQDFADIKPDLLYLYSDYYRSNKISISYNQSVDESNKPLYFAKLYNTSIEAAKKKYVAEKYNLTVKLDFYNDITFWKYAPQSDPDEYKAIIIKGKYNIFYDNKFKYSVFDYLNDNTKSSVAKITDYLLAIPKYLQNESPFLYKTYDKAIQDALKGKGNVKVLSHTDKDIVLELSLPFQQNLQYLVIVKLKKINGAYVPQKYFHKSSNDPNAISLWEVNCEYNSIQADFPFPDKVTINIYGYFENSERMEIRREVFSNIHAEKIDLKGGEFLPLKLPSGTIIRLSEKDNGCVIVGGNPDS